MSFVLSGKKVIKSIQDRILQLKHTLRDAIKNAYPNKYPPDFIRSDNDKTCKFFLNQIDKLNKSARGPWITLHKNTLLIKLLNFGGKSIAMQIAIPKLNDLPNLMTNFT